MIQREVVLDIEHCLLARPGTSLSDVTSVLSIPVATAQCHQYLRRELPQAEIVVSASTAAGARTVGRTRRPVSPPSHRATQRRCTGSR